MKTTTRIRQAIDAIKVSLDDNQEGIHTPRSPSEILGELSSEIAALKAEKEALIAEIEHLRAQKAELLSPKAMSPKKKIVQKKQTKSETAEPPHESLLKLKSAFDGF